MCVCVRVWVCVWDWGGGGGFFVLFHVDCREIWPGHFQPYLERHSWCGCCFQAQKRSGAGCLATPGRTPSSRGETAPLRWGTTPPSCWSVTRLRWARGTRRGWGGGAPPRCSWMLLESHCSSWDYTSLEYPQDNGLKIPFIIVMVSAFAANTIETPALRTRRLVDLF